jgi:hypothetical protein
MRTNAELAMRDRLLRVSRCVRDDASGGGTALAMSSRHSKDTPMTVSDFETLDADRLTNVAGGFGAQLTAGMSRAKQLGLTITATTNGTHVKNSYHYRGRAFDAAGTPGAMREFYREMAHTHPTELFYDPMGGIKNGHNIGAIGGHSNHVHLAY